MRKTIAIILCFMILMANMPLTVFGAEKISAKLIQMEGDVQVIRAGGEKPFKAFVNMRLTEGDRIITGPSGKAKVEMDDEVIITLAENTRIYLSELRGSNGAKQSSINLQSGGVGSSVKEKLKDNSRFEIKTPTAVMGVRGTEFFTQYYNGNVDVRVVDGIVEVTVNVTKEGDVTGVSGTGARTYTFPVSALQQVAFSEGEDAKDVSESIGTLDLDGLPLPFLDRIREINEEDPDAIPKEILDSIDKAVENAIKTLKEKMENKELVPDEIASSLEKTIVGNIQQSIPTIKDPPPSEPRGTSRRDSDDDSKTQILSIGEINGINVVDEELTAGTLAPANATVTYQWMRGLGDSQFVNIQGATTKEYKPTIYDAGMQLKVKVTGTGSYEGTVESEPTESIIGITAKIVEPGYIEVEIKGTTFTDNAIYDIENQNGQTQLELNWEVAGIDVFGIYLEEDNFVYISYEYFWDEERIPITIQALAAAVEAEVDTNTIYLNIYSLELIGENIYVDGYEDEYETIRLIEGTGVFIFTYQNNGQQLKTFTVNGESKIAVLEPLMEGDYIYGYAYNLIIEEDTTIEVTYEEVTIDEYEVTFIVEGESGGTISAIVYDYFDQDPGIEIESGDFVECGKTVIFTAIPPEDYYYYGIMWKVNDINIECVESWYEIVVDKNIDVIIEFKKIEA